MGRGAARGPCAAGAPANRGLQQWTLTPILAGFFQQKIQKCVQTSLAGGAPLSDAWSKIPERRGAPGNRGPRTSITTPHWRARGGRLVQAGGAGQQGCDLDVDDDPHWPARAARSCQRGSTNTCTRAHIYAHPPTHTHPPTRTPQHTHARARACTHTLRAARSLLAALTVRHSSWNAGSSADSRRAWGV